MAGTYKSDTMPVIEYYAAQGKVAEASGYSIDCIARTKRGTGG